MKVCVLNGSPKGQESITIQYVRFLEQAFPTHSFVVEDVGQKIHTIETRDGEFTRIIGSVSSADIILFATPVYYMLVPAQFKRFIELVFSRNATAAFDKKYTATMTTSIHFFDHTAHAYLTGIAEDLGMQVLGSFSAKMDDLLDVRHQEELVLFGKTLFESAAENPVIQRRSAPVVAAEQIYRPGPIPLPLDTRGKSVLILTDAAPGSNLEKMVQRAAACCGRSASIVSFEEAKMKGGCVGCCRCAFDNSCVYDDGFAGFMKNIIIPADIIIFAGTVKDRYFSASFKQFFDRSFFMGHVPVMTGKQIGILAQGPYSRSQPLPEVIAAYTSGQGASLSGIVTDEDPEQIDDRIDSLIATCIRLANAGYVSPPQFPAIAGHKVMRDEIWGGMRAIFKADDRYYRAHGGYDFPQYQYVRRFRTALLALALSLPPVRKEAEKTMKQHMIQPFARVFTASPVLARLRKKE
ncbi:NAD(P)H-dependent oxidoreductase [uncultured Methanoregula sp.]|uniref:NAD(P)H-dependent oxidoreductase n=1 Tax=uncultured Methanoregula sp. TaxID=1005933 RepID=UPI002AAB9CDE|nr:NAD(P)H-dependent oxidoreductase [uncultured Methanoregula sp.]